MLESELSIFNQMVTANIKSRFPFIRNYFSKCHSFDHVAYIICCLAISQEIADGVNKSAQALHAAEAGIRQIGSVAQQQTICMYNLFAEIALLFLLYSSPLHLIFHFYVWFSTTAFGSSIVSYIIQRSKKVGGELLDLFLILVDLFSFCDG